MLSKTAQETLLKTLKYSEADIKNLLGDEEKDITLPDGIKVYSKEEFDTVEGNLNKKSINAGKEIVIKELKEAHGLEFEGKGIDKFVDAFRKKILEEANVSVSDKETAWKKEKSELQKALGDKDAVVKALESEKNGLLTDTKLIRLFPKDRDSKFTDEQWLTLLKGEMKMETEDGIEVVYHKGKKMQDDKFNALSADKAIDAIFANNKWKAEAEQEPIKGRGLGNTNNISGVVKNMSEFRKYAEGKGVKNLNGEQGQALLKEVVKSNPAFVYSE